MSHARPYEEVHQLLQRHGGSSEYLPGGDPRGGGVWKFELHGRTAEVKVHDRDLNALDDMYECSVPNPRSWDDYKDSPGLKDDAFWHLMALFYGVRTP